jgi:hypothetical protein
MPDYLFLMRNDAPQSASEPSRYDWGSYLARLQAAGSFEGGSAIGAGLCVRKFGEAPAITRHLSGFLRITAASLEEAQTLLPGNPVYEAGGTIEIRELPRE